MKIYQHIKMNYDDAVTLVKNDYGSQANDILNSLCHDAIITLGNLHNQNIKRQINSATLVRLSTMEPHRQVGYLSNPLLEFMIQMCISDIQNPRSVQTAPVNNNVNNKNNKKKNNKQETKPEPKPEPEPIEEDEVPTPFDLFG